MIVGLNLLYLLPGVVGGTETYARGLIDGLARLDTGHRFVLYLNAECGGEFRELPANFSAVRCSVRAANRSARYAYEQSILPLLLRRDKIDLVHSLGYVCPLFTPCLNVVTIHDLNFAVSEISMSRSRRSTLKWFVQQSAHSADRIFTDSEFSYAQIQTLWNIDPSKVKVMYLGLETPAAMLTGLPNSVDLTEPLASRLPSPRIVAFGNTSRHKNIAALIEAFARVCDQIPHQLVLIGHEPRGEQYTREAARLNVSDRVTVTGYVSEGVKAHLLKSADMLVFPSLYEGFGIPVLEAQASGVPVVCSRAASLPEVAGDAALYFDPRSMDEMALQILACASSAALRSELTAKGFRNLTRFHSWADVATQTVREYEILAKRRRNT